MNPFASLEKLINEHGSASILRERIELGKEQFSFLESKNEDLTTQNSALKSEKEKLTKENAGLKIELEQARQEIERFKRPPSNPPQIQWDSTGGTINSPI